MDNNNKTVLDLLASHPSAKAREIKDLIFGGFYISLNNAETNLPDNVFKGSVVPATFLQLLATGMWQKLYCTSHVILVVCNFPCNRHFPSVSCILCLPHLLQHLELGSVLHICCSFRSSNGDWE